MIASPHSQQLHTKPLKRKTKKKKRRQLHGQFSSSAQAAAAAPPLTHDSATGYVPSRTKAKDCITEGPGADTWGLIVSASHPAESSQERGAGCTNPAAVYHLPSPPRMSAASFFFTSFPRFSLFLNNFFLFFLLNCCLECSCMRAPEELEHASNGTATSASSMPGLQKIPHRNQEM